jgi:NAD(P)-dependent dehydrogenase (short-subunit alcohol dehydrogenase family)
MLAAQRLRTLVYHLPWPGLGHFVKRGDGFHFEPEPISLMLEGGAAARDGTAQLPLAVTAALARLSRGSLQRKGVDVALIARERTALETAAAEIADAAKRRVKGYVADTGDDAAVRAAVAQAFSEFGRVDILVNCAAAVGGQGKPPTLAEITTEAFFADMNVKVMGYLRMIREVAPHMAAQGGGRIINISGLAALKLHDRLDPQRGCRRTDEEPCGRTRAIRHLGGLRAPRSYAHRKDSRVRQTASKGAWCHP